MRGNDLVSKVVAEWTAKADNDLKNAAHTLKLGADCPTDTVCFHAQPRFGRGVEKYLKALLVCLGIDFPKAHDLSELIAPLPARIKIGLTLSEPRQLTNYAVAARYPGGDEPISLAEARSAVALARRARKEIKKYLPKETRPNNHNRGLF
jgi:HEPN domain-containing protein